jgi:hypothetical protein
MYQPILSNDSVNNGRCWVRIVPRYTGTEPSAQHQWQPRDSNKLLHFLHGPYWGIVSEGQQQVSSEARVDSSVQWTSYRVTVASHKVSTELKDIAGDDQCRHSWLWWLIACCSELQIVWNSNNAIVTCSTSCKSSINPIAYPNPVYSHVINANINVSSGWRGDSIEHSLLNLAGSKKLNSVS